MATAGTHPAAQALQRIIHLLGAGDDLGQQGFGCRTGGKVGVDRLGDLVTMLQQQGLQCPQMLATQLQRGHRLPRESLLLLVEQTIQPGELLG